jgi:hypothetical protein
VEANFFEQYGLELQKKKNLSIGETYPIYGMITEVLEETPAGVEVVINFNLKACLLVDCPEKRGIILDRAFEPGIFVSTVTGIDGKAISVDCKTVVFGRKATAELN